MFKKIRSWQRPRSCAMTASAQAQTILTAETAAPNTTPGISIISLSEASAKAGVADIQVTSGQTLTNSVQNVAEGKTDIAAAPFILPFLLSRGVGPYAGLGKEEGRQARLQILRCLYTYRISVQGLFAYDSANISGWDGIEGKTIYQRPAARRCADQCAASDQGEFRSGRRLRL